MSQIINIILGAVVLFAVVVLFYGCQPNIRKVDLEMRAAATVHHAAHTVRMKLNKCRGSR